MWHAVNCCKHTITNKNNYNSHTTCTLKLDPVLANELSSNKNQSSFNSFIILHSKAGRPPSSLQSLSICLYNDHLCPSL